MAARACRAGQAPIRKMRSARPQQQPLDLAIRAASAVVGALEASPPPPATPAQRIVLGAAAAQLRSRAGRTLMSGGGQETRTCETALGQLVARTLALVEEAMAGPPALTSPTDVRSPELDAATGTARACWEPGRAGADAAMPARGNPEAPWFL